MGALAPALMALASCGGGGGDTAAPMQGALTINMTDAPVDGASEVVVAFTGIELHRTDGQTVTIDLPSTRAIDLIKLQNGITSALTQDTAVAAGTYDWMRLKVLASKNSQGESYIRMLNGTQYPLWIPSGSETGLKLNRAFTVAQGSTTRLIIDFDLRKSIHAPPGQDPNYIMRPTLRIIDQLQVGKLAATVDLAALSASQIAPGSPASACKGGLYLFAGAAATPDDQDGDSADGADPVLYLPLAYDGVNPVVSVNVPFIEVGSYTVAATCDFNVDAADTNDFRPAALAGEAGYRTMRWTTRTGVSVSANNTTAVAFP